LNPKLINKSKPKVNFDKPKTKFKIGEEKSKYQDKQITKTAFEYQMESFFDVASFA
jgi:hypothetical protein